MNDEELIGYLLNAVNADERLAVEGYLRGHPEAVARLDRLRLAVAPLEADRDLPTPPAGLAMRTVSRLAAYLVEHEPRRSRPSSDAELILAAEAISKEHDAAQAAIESETYPSSLSKLPRAPREAAESRAMGGRLRPDLLVACGIGLFALGLVISGIGNLRARNEMVACQNSLRTMHTGLSGYADTHDGRYPQVVAGLPAETFATSLVSAGQVPESFRPACPSTRAQDLSKPTTPAVGYTYSLGYRTAGGHLVGLTRPSSTPSEHDLLPISADYPTPDAAPAAGPTCPHNRGMNVLYVGGNVRNTTTPLIGPNGDHIFQNIFGNPEAGADRSDVVLGRPGDRP